MLTFRNVHNWGTGYMHPEKKAYSGEAFREMFAMLKPGGVLGIVDHRLPESASAEREKSSGYIKVSTVRALAEAAGFKTSARPRSTRIQKTRPSGRTACGRFRRVLEKATWTGTSTLPSARATG